MQKRKGLLVEGQYPQDLPEWNELIRLFDERPPTGSLADNEEYTDRSYESGA